MSQISLVDADSSLLELSQHKPPATASRFERNHDRLVKAVEIS
jgi:hypothetical protein